MIDSILRWIDATPQNVWAVLGALLCSHAATQWLKFYLPKDASEAFKTHAPRVIAFSFAAPPVAVLWDGPIEVKLFAALCTGLWAPTFWLIAMRILGVIAPRFREALSIDARGTP